MCNQCDAITINGVYCHEHGCPDAWKSELRECRECGERFKPEDRGQRKCASCMFDEMDSIYQAGNCDDCFFDETEDGCDAGHYDCTDGL